MTRMRRTKRRRRCRVLFLVQSSPRSRTFVGLMLRDSTQPRSRFRKRSFCRSSSHSYSTRHANPGVVFCFTGLQERASLTWPRRAPQSARARSSASALRTWSASGWASPRSSSSNFSKWPERQSHRSSSSMKSIPCAEAEAKEKMIPQEESKLSSSYKCRVSATTWMESLSLAPPTCLGSSITPSAVVLRSVSTFRFLMLQPVQASSRSELARQSTTYKRATGLCLENSPKATQALILQSL